MNAMNYQTLLERAKERILYQDKALSELAITLHYHLKSASIYQEYEKKLAYQDKFIKSNPGVTVTFTNPAVKPEPIGTAPIFLLGKTGAGKTHLVRELCRVSDVNFLAVNVTHLSNAGYKGMTLAEVGEMLLKNAKDNMAKAMFSVVFFDEFDKLFVATSDNQVSYHRGLATELLTILEGTSLFPVKDKDGIESGYMLFILGGSFGLHHKDKSSAIGFTAENDEQSLPKNQLDFLKMGFFDELAGRIGRTIALEPLDNTMLADILLNSPSSPFVKLQKQLKLEGNELKIEPALIEQLIADNEEAIDKFGVRGLYQAFSALPQISEVLVLGVSASYKQRFTIKTSKVLAEPLTDYQADESAFLGVENKSVVEDDDLPF